MMPRSQKPLVMGVVLMVVTGGLASPEPPLIGASGPVNGAIGNGYSYGPPPPSPSITVNSYGSATSEYGPPTQAPIIHKHVYVHVPPPEPEYQTTSSCCVFGLKPDYWCWNIARLSRAMSYGRNGRTSTHLGSILGMQVTNSVRGLRRRRRKPIVVPPPQKHYKIVFIKAPSPPASAPPVLPPVQQNEEKTLVYVLVKKQDEPEEIIVPTVAPTPPSKPEVYFIRYKTQRASTSAEQGSNGGGPYPESGGPTPSTEYGAPPLPSQSPSNSYGVPL